MTNLFNDAARHLMSPPVEEWIQNGGRVLGYTCSFLPPEIVHAAGLLPYRIRGIETGSMEIGNTYYGPYVCAFPKCLLQLAGEGKYRFLNGAVISTGCDAMRRLDECWRKAGEDHPGTLPPFFYYFDVPHKTDAHAMRWFIDELNIFIKAMEAHFNVSITEDGLRDAIRLYNRGRELLAEIEALRAADPTMISGTDAFAVAVAGTVMPREVFNRDLEEQIAEIRRKGAPTGNGGRRIMVAGSISDDMDLVQLVEESGATVVADNLCFGIRSGTDQVGLEGDPVTALAERYLSDSVCPRMFGAYRQRFENMRQKAEQTGADGIILQNVRFCDMHGSENGLFERDFEKLGLPCLRVEREYGPMTDTGRMQMRIDAFLERLG